MEPFVVLLTAVVILATAVVGFMAKLNKDVSEIHVMVNSQMDEAVRRIDQLVDALREAGIEVPDAQRRDT